MLLRFRQDVIDLGPKVVVILAGTNDLADPMTHEQPKANLSRMAELARAHGIRVVLASLLPVSDHGHGRDGEPVIQTARRAPTDIVAS